MILLETKVWTPEGWKEARLLEKDEPIYSWNGRFWAKNQVGKVREGRARKTIGIVRLDGMTPTILRCTPDQEIRLVKLRFLTADETRAGTMVMCSEGAHVFRAEVNCVERETWDQPEDVLGLDLAKPPRNFLAAGFLCR